MLAAMLRQSSSGGGPGGGSGGVGGNKLTLGISRLSSSSMGSGSPSRLAKNNSVSSDNQDAAPADPNYIMQLVSDVRKFADVLLQLKEVFNSKGVLGSMLSLHASRVFAFAIFLFCRCNVAETVCF